jgi:hypothetical protein
MTKAASVTKETASKGKKPRRSYPIVTLEDALKIPEAVKAKNSGQPLESKLVAKAVGIAHMSAKFFYHSSAARDYGLTVGTRDTANIELTELGRAIVYADTPKSTARRRSKPSSRSRNLSKSTTTATAATYRKSSTFRTL